MGHYTPTVVKTFQFEDEEVKVQFRRLKRKHLVKLLPIVGGMKEDSKEDLYESAEKLLGMFGDTASEYIVSITGLHDNEGNEVPVSAVTEESYFFGLYADIIVEMIQASMGPMGKV